MVLAVMAKGKKPPIRKSGSTGKAAGKAKPRKPSKKSAAKPGKGHNRPPPDHVPPPPKAPPVMPPGWQTDTTGEIARHMATRQRHFRAALGIGTPTTDTPHALAYDPTHLHQVMRRHIAALEGTIKKLAVPLSEEVKDVERKLAKLKALPPSPKRLTPDVVEAPSKLKKFGEQVLSDVAKQAASTAVKEAAKQLWASYGHQLIAAAQSIGEWIANLPL
jgi:hypothetical protein